VYLKVCLARHHLRQLVAAQKVALGRPSPYADRRTLTDPHVGNCARFINTTTARLVAQFPPRFSAHTLSLSAHPRSGGCNGRNVPTADSQKPPANQCAPLVGLLAIIKRYWATDFLQSLSYSGTVITPPPLRFGSSQPAFGNRR
jgi:hypothetical protein